MAGCLTQLRLSFSLQMAGMNFCGMVEVVQMQVVELCCVRLMPDVTGYMFSKKVHFLTNLSPEHYPIIIVDKKVLFIWQI